ncbi:uncharacterized protein C2845_PM11G07450 [Panicum miliaceum]|uniref:Disease resistance RPP13-like protein 4 n=1 Tax=Panicum miliaceum TaxID=4540 RepID=A0A3L6RUB2_PANMI|nr:uncharacterized protein C2845_PM11G07450 [Panicum miliaceum]
MEEGKGDGIEPATSPDKGADVDTKPVEADGKQAASGLEEEKPKPPHPKWPREEARLEEILEGAFTRLLASEYHHLSSIRQKCLLTFSVFELASEVKKQVMVYWWVSEFNLQHRSDQSATDVAPAEIRRSKTLRRARKPAAPAGRNHLPSPQGKVKDGGNPDAEAEGIFSEISSHGFLEPTKNWCSKVIHGCKVNPMVHWMVKRRARDDRFGDLDMNGNPAVLQPNSSTLCLTKDNRQLLQRMRTEDESQQTGNKQQPKTTRTTSLHSSTKDKAPAQDLKDIDYEEIAQIFKGKKVILNMNAHVYPVSKSTFLHLADCLVVLQLGPWCNADDNTYMEVDDLESLSDINLLKNLRYLSLRGLSRLTELPKGIQSLKKLAIIDMCGCQNLVNVASEITKLLKQLTHLDLTECYMLEHIGRGITSLSKLRRLKKLQKLTVSITTDANVGKGEMVEFKQLVSLHKLTIIWSEIPSILDGDSEEVKKKRKNLIEKWTRFELPQELLKLDLRCYPKNELKLQEHKNLKKLYLRGGDLERFSIDESKHSNALEKTNFIKTLRLRYLKNFNMEWEEIRLLLTDIEYVEIVPKDEKLVKDVNKDKKDKNIDMEDRKDKDIDVNDQMDKVEESKLVKNIEMNTDTKDQNDIEEECNLVKRKKVSYSCLDENGVWVKDNKEEENLSLIAQATKKKEAHGTTENSKGPIEDPSTKAASTDKDVNKDDNNNAIKEQSGLPFSKDKAI